MKKKITHRPYDVMGRIKSITIIVCAIAAIVVAHRAFGQTDDWAQPAADVLDSLRDGLVLLGGGLLSVAAAIIGISYFFNREFDLRRIFPYVAGALMLFFGATAIEALLN